MEDQKAVHGHDDRDMTAVAQSEMSLGRGESFAVRFQKAARSQHERIGPGRFQGSGRIVVEDARIGFYGKPGQFGWLSKEQCFSVAASDVFNVERVGKLLSFQLRSKTGVVNTIKIAASDVTNAVRLSTRFPAQQTPEFALVSAERADFQTRLDALSPKSIVVPVLVAINVAVFIAMCLNGVNIFKPDAEAVLSWGSNYGPLTSSGQWWRLVTNTFVHFGILHIAFNMWALYASGRTVERLFGSVRFMLLYLFAGIAASMVSLLWHSDVNSAGASGAIFGVFGGMLAFVLNKRNEVPQSVMIEQRNSTIGFAAYSLFYGVAHAGVDNAAHVGGLAAGLAMGFVLARPLTAGARRAANPASFASGLAFGVIALIALSWPITHPNAQTAGARQYGLLTTHLGKDEQGAIDAIQTLQQHAASEKWSNERIASALSSDVIPKWEAIYREVSAVQLQPDDSNYKLHSAMLRYFDARRRQFSLYGLALRTNDTSLRAQADEQRSVAEQALADMKAAQSAKH